MSKEETKKKIHKIVVDRKACISAGTCVVVSPDGFELDDESIAIVRPGADDLDDSELLMAAQSCPTAAIILYDENGEQIFPKP
jgi:ferredoxin